MIFSRRGLLKLAMSCCGIFLPLAKSQKSVLAQEYCTTIEITPKEWGPFQEALPIPTTLTPVCSWEGEMGDKPTDFFEITMQKCQCSIGGELVEIWGYNGLIPGPIIRQRKGRQSVIRFVNNLGIDDSGEPIDSVIHLHGMASKPQYDGYAEDYIPPGYYKDYYYPNNRAATIWYHDHVLHNTQRNVQKGLLGLYIVEDQIELDLPLPKNEFDVPLILHKHPNGSLNVLVNGEQQPYLRVAKRKYRFRVLNATDTKTFNLKISGAIMTVIGTDGGLMRNPVDGVTELRLTTGERYEFIIDFANLSSSEVFLENCQASSNCRESLLRFDIIPDSVEDESSIPSILRQDREPPKREQASIIRELIFDRDGNADCSENPVWAINGDTWDTQVADPQNKAIEIWKFINKSSFTVHPVHVHLIDMYILSRAGVNNSGLRDYEKNWKDVFFLGGNETVEVIGEFGPHNGKYMMHCHNLSHEDCDMMVTFQVGNEGDDPLSAPSQPLPAPQFCQLTDNFEKVYDFEVIEEYDEEVYGTSN